MYQMSQSYMPVQRGYSGLEAMASSYSPSGNVAYATAAPIPQSYMHTPTISFQPQSSFSYDAESLTYNAAHEHQMYDLFSAKPEYHFQPDNFLKPGKGGKFVGKAEEIRGFVEETFSKMFNKSFPSDIKMMGAGLLNNSKMITNRFPLEKSIEAIRKSSKKKDGKVIVKP